MMGGLISLAESLFVPPDNVIQFKSRRFRIKRLIGEGGFSFVFLVQDLESKEVFALKRICAQVAEQYNDAMREIEVHRLLAEHPNIQPLIDAMVVPSSVVSGAKDILLLYPYHNRGTLLDILRKSKDSDNRNRGGGSSVPDGPVPTTEEDDGDDSESMDKSTPPVCLSQSEIIQVFLGVCNAVRVFHQHVPAYAHRDIKPGNVMLKESVTQGLSTTGSGLFDSTVPVLMDFGSARPARVDIVDRKVGLALEEEATRMSSMAYRAPELFHAPTGDFIDERSDIWSLGCLLYAMAFGHSPFELAESEHNGSVAMAVQSGRIHFPEPLTSRYSNEFLDVMLHQLQLNPRERPSINEVIEECNIVLAKYPPVPSSANERKGEPDAALMEPTFDAHFEDHFPPQPLLQL